MNKAQWSLAACMARGERRRLWEEYARLARWRFLPWVAVRRARLRRQAVNLGTMEELAERGVKYGEDE